MDLRRCWKVWKAERREEREQAGRANECRSGLLERPQRDLLPGIRANPIIAAKERELRETMRARMNIGYRGWLPYLTAESAMNASAA